MPSYNKDKHYTKMDELIDELIEAVDGLVSMLKLTYDRVDVFEYGSAREIHYCDHNEEFKRMIALVLYPDGDDEFHYEVFYDHARQGKFQELAKAVDLIEYMIVTFAGVQA